MGLVTYRHKQDVNGHTSEYNVYEIEIDGHKHIGIEDIGIGVSVTNAIEDIASVLQLTRGLKTTDRFFEWYKDGDEVSEVKFKWSFSYTNDLLHQKATCPDWTFYSSTEDNHFFQDPKKILEII